MAERRNKRGDGCDSDLKQELPAPEERGVVRDEANASSLMCDLSLGGRAINVTVL